MRTIKHKARKRMLIIALGSLALLLMIAFQMYWLDSVYKSQKKMVLDKALLVVREYVGNRDGVAFVEKLESPTSILPEHYLDDILDVAKQADPMSIHEGSLENLSPDELRKLLDSKVSVTMNSKIESISQIEVKLKKEYPGINLKIDSTRYDGMGGDADNVPIRRNSVEAISTYYPYKYKLTVLNIGNLVVQEMLPMLVLSFVYLIICISAVVILIRNIFKGWKLLEMKISFTNNMTHELKTPIAILYTATEALDNFDMLDDRQKSREYIQFMKSGLKRLSTMTENILEMALLNSGVVRLDKKELQLSALVADVCYKFKPLLADREATVSTLFVPTEIKLYADKEHIENVISNLMDNALKYSDGKAVIIISGAIKQSGLILLFEDKGKGIEEQYREEIFNPYFRANKTDVFNVRGYGLGLSYTREILEMHGGSIKLLKSEIGKGSIFEIKLPL